MAKLIPPSPSRPEGVGILSDNIIFLASARLFMATRGSLGRSGVAERDPVDEGPPEGELEAGVEVSREEVLVEYCA